MLAKTFLATLLLPVRSTGHGCTDMAFTVKFKHNFADYKPAYLCPCDTHEFPSDLGTSKKPGLILDGCQYQPRGFRHLIGNASPSLRYLKLLNANFTFLPADSFQGMPNLAYIVLEHSPLEAVVRGTFSGLPKLEYLSLRNNRLSMLSANVFHDLCNLAYLMLEHNQLNTVSDDAFNGLSNLLDLHLEKNALTRLSGIRTGDLKHLGYLNLDENKIQDIPADFVKPLSSLRVFRLFANPLKSLPNDFSSYIPNLQQFVVRKEGIVNKVSRSVFSCWEKDVFEYSHFNGMIDTDAKKLCHVQYRTDGRRCENPAKKNGKIYMCDKGSEEKASCSPPGEEYRGYKCYNACAKYEGDYYSCDYKWWGMSYRGYCSPASACHLITDEATCVSSVDGRDGRYANEPCVWCCGDACTANNSNKCEPLKFLSQKEQKKWNGKGKYKDEDTCLNPSRVPVVAPQALHRVQRSWPSAIGISTTTAFTTETRASFSSTTVVTSAATSSTTHPPPDTTVPPTTASSSTTVAASATTTDTTPVTTHTTPVTSTTHTPTVTSTTHTPPVTSTITRIHISPVTTSTTVASTTTSTSTSSKPTSAITMTSTIGATSTNATTVSNATTVIGATSTNATTVETGAHRSPVDKNDTDNGIDGAVVKYVVGATFVVVALFMAVYVVHYWRRSSERGVEPDEICHFEDTRERSCSLTTVSLVEV